jgi:hypothetical protein
MRLCQGIHVIFLPSFGLSLVCAQALPTWRCWASLGGSRWRTLQRWPSVGSGIGWSRCRTRAPPYRHSWRTVPWLMSLFWFLICLCMSLPLEPLHSRQQPSTGVVGGSNPSVATHFLFVCLFVFYRGRPDQGSVQEQSLAAQCGISRVNVRAAR